MRENGKNDADKAPNAVKNNRYQLRYAAGVYWLLDMEQPGVPYVKPVPMNGMGADIWRMHGQGLTAKEIAGKLSAACEVSESQAETDVCAFLKELKAQGIRM